MTKQQIEALRKLTGQEWHEAGGIVRDDHDHDICVIAEIWKWEPDFGPLTPEKRNDLAIAIAALPDLLAEREKMIEMLKEMREACAACFRVIAVTSEQHIDLLDGELTAVGVKHGFGERCQELIAEAEGGE